MDYLLIFLPLAFMKELIVQDTMSQIIRLPGNTTFTTVIPSHSPGYLPYFGHDSVTIDVKLSHIDENTYPLCTVTQQDIIFGENNSRKNHLLLEKFDPVLHPNDPSYFLKSPILVTFVKNGSEIFAITTDHTLIKYNLQTLARVDYDFSKLRPNATESEMPQLVLGKNIIFIIFKFQLIYGKITESNIDLKNYSLHDLQKERNYIGNVKLNNNHLFVPLGSEGVEIYSVNEDGWLELKKTIDSQTLYGEKKKVFLNDVFIDGDCLYVLDQIAGVTQFNISEQTGFMFNMKKNDDLGLIDAVGCEIIKAFNHTVLMVMCERQQNSFVLEFGLFQMKSWFKLKTHFLIGRYFDMDITNKFAVLRGIDAHRILYHGIWEKFEPSFDIEGEDDLMKEEYIKQDEEYLYLPRLQALEFHNGTSLLGMNFYELIEVPFWQENPGVVCMSTISENYDKIFKYLVKVNQTQCKEKTEYLNANPNIPEQLLICEKSYQLIIQVNEGEFHDKFNITNLQKIIVLLCITLVILGGCLCILYRRFKKRKEQMTAEIKGFDEHKPYEVNEAI